MNREQPEQSTGESPTPFARPFVRLGAGDYVVLIIMSLIFAFALLSAYVAFEEFVLQTNLERLGPAESQWWTALSLLVAVSFAALGFNLYRFRELDQLRNELESKLHASEQLRLKVEQLQREHGDILGNYVKYLSVVLDLEHVRELQSPKAWENFQSFIDDAVDKKAVDADTLLRLSSMIWQWDHLEECRMLREQAKTRYPDDPVPVAYLANFLVLTPPPGQSTSPDDLDDLWDRIEEDANYVLIHARDGILRERNARSLAFGTLGRVAWQRGDFPSAITNFRRAVTFNSASWPYRSHIISLLACNKEDEARRVIEGWKEQHAKNNNTKWFADASITHRLFVSFTNAYLGDMSDDEFYQEVLKEVKSLLTLGNYASMSLINVFQKMEKEVQDKKKHLLYLTYYFFAGDRDDRAEEAIDEGYRQKILQNLFGRIL